MHRNMIGLRSRPQTCRSRRAIVRNNPVRVTPTGGSDGNQHRKTEIHCRARRHGVRLATRCPCATAGGAADRGSYWIAAGRPGSTKVGQSISRRAATARLETGRQSADRLALGGRSRANARSGKGDRRTAARSHCRHDDAPDSGCIAGDPYNSGGLCRGVRSGRVRFRAELVSAGRQRDCRDEP